MQSTNFLNVPKKTLLRPDEVADIFQVNIKTVYRWRDEGKLEGIKPSPKCLRFPRANVVIFLSRFSSV